MISVIACSIDSTKFMAVAATFRQAMGDEPYEIIRIANAKSLAEGYNRGLRQSKGETVIFCHDDIEILSNDFASRLKGHLADCDVVGVAGTSKLVGPGWAMAGIPYLFGQVAHVQPKLSGYQVCFYGTPSRRVHNIQAMDGLFLAFNRSVIESTGWDEQTFDGFHLYDVDCTYRAFLAGYKLAVANDVHLLHHSLGKFDAKWNAYADKFRQKHAGTLPAFIHRPFGFAHIQVPNKATALEVMSPSYWND